MKCSHQAGRAATSVISANTCSRGAEMWARTVTGSTAAILRSVRSPGGRTETALFALSGRRRYTGRPAVWEEREMQTVVSGTLAGAGTFRCEGCSYPVALLERDEIPP